MIHSFFISDNLQFKEPGDVTEDGDDDDWNDVVPCWPKMAHLEEGEADCNVALQSQTHRQQNRT